METFNATIITLYNKSTQPFDIIYNNQLIRTIPVGKAIRIPVQPYGELAKKHLVDRMCNEAKQPTNDATIRAKWEAEVVLDLEQDASEEALTPEEMLKRQLDKLNGSNESESIKTCDLCGVKTFNLIEHNMLNHRVDDDPIAPVVATPPALVTPTVVASVVTPSATNLPPVVPQVAPPVEIIDAGMTPPPVEKPVPQTVEQKEVASILRGAVHADDAQVLPEQVEEENPAPAAPPVVATVTPTRDELIAYARDTLLMNVSDPKTKEILDSTPLEQLIKELNYGI